jgi:hypothetical protein
MTMVDANTPATREEIAENVFFQGLYAAWLQARAIDQRSGHDDESLEAASARIEAVEEAARQLIIRPAIYAWQVWMKWDVLENFLDADSKDACHLERQTIVALSCIKADILHFGFGK